MCTIKRHLMNHNYDEEHMCDPQITSSISYLPLFSQGHINQLLENFFLFFSSSHNNRRRPTDSSASVWSKTSMCDVFVVQIHDSNESSRQSICAYARHGNCARYSHLLLLHTHSILPQFVPESAAVSVLNLFLLTQ